MFRSSPIAAPFRAPRLPTRRPASGFSPLFALLAALLPVLLLGCGPGGDNNLATPTPYSGVVKVPAGVVLVKPTLVAKVSSQLSSALFPEAWALSGMTAVGAGVEVRVFAIDASGKQFGPVLSTTTTDGNGRYTVMLPSWSLYHPDYPWVVAVGSEAVGTLMRRLVDDLTNTPTDRDIDPATEAAVRLLVEDNEPLQWKRITPAEMAAITDEVVAAAKPVGGATVLEVAVLALEAARDYEPAQRKLVEIGSPPENHRPLALAGVDYRTETGASLNVVGKGEDADGDPLTFQWSVDSAPAASMVLRTPSAGAAFTFQPDVDGVYRLKLVVTDGKQQGPPDYTTFIATTAPVQITNNTVPDSEGHMTRDRNLLIYTSVVRDAAKNLNSTNVELQRFSAVGPVGIPTPLYPPGVPQQPTSILHTVESNPFISGDGTMAVFATDVNLALAGTGEGGADFDIVAVPVSQPTAPLWISSNTTHESQPVVECAAGWACTAVYLSALDPKTTTHLVAVDLVDSGTGFVAGPPRTLTTGLGFRFSPRLTSDGSQVFYLARDADGDLEVFRLRTDGSQGAPDQLTFNTLDDDELQIDPFGTQVVVRRGLHEIWRLTVPPTGPPVVADVLLSGTQLIAREPVIAGNGMVAAFVANTTDTAGGTDLFTVEPDGRALTRVTADGTISSPQLDDTGLHILFRSARDGDHDYYLLNR
ncbi:MAG: hypothetical protein OEW11_06255 [Nitrospirota bacterium]|nr:hypothetical protein [Nitrospirota bacterium]